MIAFWIAAALFIAVALAFLLPPLLRQTPAGSVSGNAANVSVYRDQLVELDNDLERGTISADQHAQAKSELESRVLDDVGTEAVAAPGVAPPRRGRGWIVALTIGVGIPVVAVGLYQWLGTPAALNPEVRLGMSEAEAAERRKMLDLTAQLAKKMQSRPDDSTGWMMLGRSYLALGKPADAALALGRAALLKPKDAQAQADFAEALAIAGRGPIGEQALEVTKRALALDPNNQKALALAGTAAFEAKDYRNAVAYWERLLAQAPPGSEFARAVEGGIAEAKAAMGSADQPAAAGAKVTGRVELAAALKDKASPNDTVFIFARAASGPRMPLAIMRKQVKDLPLAFTLDDSMAMAPGMQLSAFPLVVVGARVSKAGSAMPASGDLEGTSAQVKPGANGIAIVIDRVVP
ncbi:MAG: c-type cytochrome biogenesis protein CcmI [Betaproteobacteria bacterium]